MTTLKDVLRRCYGYGGADFGAAGMLRADCAEGTLSPVPMRDIFTPHRGEPRKVVRLATLFRPGQRLTVLGTGHSPTLDLAVCAVQDDGLRVKIAAAAEEFLPWERLRHALMRPELLIFHDNSGRSGNDDDPAKKIAKSLCTARRLAL